MKELRGTFEPIWQACSGEAAWQTVADLSRIHRIQASPGYRQAAELVHRRLAAAGMDAKIHSYPANEQTHFWSWASFREWDCTSATLHLLPPHAESAGQAPAAPDLLADFGACPISLIQRSAPFAGEVDLVLLEDGTEAEHYAGIDVAGKAVLTQGNVARVREMAVQKRGAVGVLYDGMRVVEPVRPEGDLADFRQYTSFWWQPGDTRCFGFVLTPRQGWALRRRLKAAAAPVRLQVQVESREYDGALEVVDANIPGDGKQEVLLVAHLCHPLPSANDNASGAAALLEAARVLQALIASGRLPRPKRTIRFIWVPEMTGSLAYLAEREADLGRIVAGLNLDMVGEDQNQTGSSWLAERPPDAAASFASDLLGRLRDEMPALRGMAGMGAGTSSFGAFPLYRHAEIPFSGGSDHYVLSDPTVGIPTPMLIQWPDRFYHTSADTPDRTDPNALARSAALAAMYAYWLAAADLGGANWLGHEMVARFKRGAITAAQSTVTAALAQRDGASLATALADLDRRLAYMLNRQKAALRSLERLAPVQCLTVDLGLEAERAANHELGWARGVIDLHAASLSMGPLPEPPTYSLSPEEEQASKLIPARTVRGPISLDHHLGRLDEQERENWRLLMKARTSGAHHTLLPLALYWANGTRSVLEIVDRVEMEAGERDVGLVLTYFRLLERLGLVSFGPNTATKRRKDRA